MPKTATIAQQVAQRLRYERQAETGQIELSNDTVNRCEHCALAGTRFCDSPINHRCTRFVLDTMQSISANFLGGHVHVRRW